MLVLLVPLPFWWGIRQSLVNNNYDWLAYVVCILHEATKARPNSSSICKECAPIGLTNFSIDVAPSNKTTGAHRCSFSQSVLMHTHGIRSRSSCIDCQRYMHPQSVVGSPHVLPNNKREDGGSQTRVILALNLGCSAFAYPNSLHSIVLSPSECRPYTAARHIGAET